MSEKYKDIPDKLVHIDNFVQVCGMFGNNGLNNGYGCLSKDESKDEPGYCYAWNCPLANEADLTSIKDLDEGLYQEYKEQFKQELNNGETEENCIVNDWMVQYRELI
jgi:hypothetical protein